MAGIVLFHHAHGLTDGVRRFAGTLRAAGHRVTTPDLFDGRTFATVEEGVAHAETIGFGAIIEAGSAAAAEVADADVFAGFSLGALPAQKLAQTDQAARACLIYHAGVPVDTFGTAWPAAVALHVHLNRGDEWGEMDVVERLVGDARAESAAAELFVYPGSSHLFADDSLPDHEPASAALLLERTLALLAGLDEAVGEGPGEDEAGEVGVTEDEATGDGAGEDEAAGEGPDDPVER